MASDKKESANYAAIVAEAEAAVASVKDAELRTVAFEKILSTLLEGGTHKSKTTGTRRKAGRAKAAVAATRKGGTTRNRTGPKAYVESLIKEGYFKTQRTIAEVKAELANRGHHIALTSLSGPLQALTQERRLRRQKISSGGQGSKTTYAYSNW